jgi:hypothetical protein
VALRHIETAHASTTIRYFRSRERLRSKTEDLIAQVADQKALAFLASPARHVINADMRPDLTPKLQKIFSDAASLSYMFWTERGSIRCRTLRDLTPLTFQGESAQLCPDVLVK